MQQRLGNVEVQLGGGPKARRKSLSGRDPILTASSSMVRDREGVVSWASGLPGSFHSRRRHFA